MLHHHLHVFTAISDRWALKMWGAAAQHSAARGETLRLSSIRHRPSCRCSRCYHWCLGVAKQLIGGALVW